MSLLDRIARSRRRPVAAGSENAPSPPRRRRWPRVLAWLAAGAALVIGAGFVIAPPIVKSLVEAKATEALGRKVIVGAVRINPLLLTVEVADFHVREADGVTDFLSFDLLRADLEVESLFRRAPVLRELHLARPRLNLVRLGAGRYNFSDVVERLSRPSSGAPSASSEPARFSLNNISVSGGELDFDDRPEKTRHKVRDLSLAVPFVSNLPYYGEIFLTPRFAAVVNGTRFALEGKTRPFARSRDTVLAIAIKGLNLPHYLEYVPVQLRTRPESGLLDADLEISFAQPPDAAPRLLVGGSAALREVVVKELDGRPLLEVPRVDVKLGALDVLARQFVLEQVRVQGPRAWVRRESDGTLNLSELVTVQASGEALQEARVEQRKATEKALEIAVGGIRVESASIAFEDAVPPGGFRAAFEPVDLEVKGFDTAPGKVTEATLSLRSDAAETLTATVRHRFVERSTEGEVSLGGIPLRRYAPYYRDASRVDIQSGTLELSTRFSVSLPDDAPLAASASAITAGLRDLRLRKRGAGEDFLALGALEASGGRFDLAARSAGLEKLTLRKPALAVKRARDGSLSIDGLGAAGPSPAAAGSSSAARTSPANPAGPARAAQAPWVVNLDRFALQQGSVRFEDEMPGQTVLTRLEPLALEVDKLVIGKPAGASLKLSAVLNGSGRIGANGSFVPQPFSTDLKVELSDVDAVPYQPYFAERINLTLTSARLAADGRLGMSAPAGPGAAAPLTWQGNAAISRFATVDKETAEDFLKWESLFFGGMKVRTEPLFVEVGEVALTDFFSRLVVNADGSLNVQGIMARQGPVDAPAAGKPAGGAVAAPAGKPGKHSPGKSGEAKKAPASPGVSRETAAAVQRLVKIDKVTLQGGTIAFSDRFIKPNVSATLTEVGGRVTGLLSEENARADVDLRGRLASQAPLSITGRINPLAGDLFADLKVSFRDIELPPFTPYSGKYTGYTIEKGRLTLELSYLIEKRKLAAENKVFIDQFTFGEKVESPDATSLPVQLAVSLLKDRDGRINLDIPIEGSLDDPKFRLGKVIWQVIVNLITKVVTAPFALIGNLFGGGASEELSTLDFAPGSAAFDDTARRKLDAIGKALRERPALSLEVIGRVDAARDRDALLQAAFDRKLKAQKMKELARRGQAPASVDAVTLEPGKDRERWLERAYKAEKFPKPRNAIGMEKDLPAAEMEKLMRANIVVADDELRALGLQRAQAVKDFLSAGQDTAATRVFLVEPRGAAGEAPSRAAASRVDFKLR